MVIIGTMFFYNRDEIIGYSGAVMYKIQMNRAYTKILSDDCGWERMIGNRDKCGAIRTAPPAARARARAADRRGYRGVTQRLKKIPRQTL
ncbi:hypothetical protein EVAR_14099_1 [Eumeta japonica]|uniref:Uncharacterized protein n=1 Tax=Eumeta variegata TaxID=151549 RepID=A0A4C1UN81_EUMVA|nr:hypothetical protein EVAR_14099_1 [Eumeta japonica]